MRQILLYETHPTYETWDTGYFQRFLYISSHLIKTVILVFISEDLIKIVIFSLTFCTPLKIWRFRAHTFVLIIRRKCVPHKKIVTCSMNTFGARKLMIEKQKKYFHEMDMRWLLKIFNLSHLIPWDKMRISWDFKYISSYCRSLQLVPLKLGI